MKVKVKIRKIDKPGCSLKAVAQVKLDDTIIINGVNVVDGEKGLFISLPADSYEKDGKIMYSRIVIIDDDDVFAEIQAAVIEKYKKVTEGDF